MAKFIIEGGTPLHGDIAVSGAKNAALKMIAASLLGEGVITLKNVPNIVDVEVMIQLVKEFGVKTQWTGNHTLVLTSNHVHPANPQPKLVKKLRASFVLVGPALARFGSIRMPFPGGDKIGRRPIDTHLLAFEQLGITVTLSANNEYTLEYPQKQDAQVFLQEPSVTATENILLASIIGSHTITIYGAATEPEIGNLVDLLHAMGAQISGENTSTLTVTGTSKLFDGEVEVIPDRIEIGTLIMAGLVTKGSVTIVNSVPEHSCYLIPRLRALGADLTISGRKLTAKIPSSPLKAITIDTRPYPGFYTDLQSPLAALLTQAEGISTIFETMYEGRFNYVPALKAMGARISIDDPHRILITGPTKLIGKTVATDDIRAGAALVLAGLAAHGKTTIDNIELIDRGYEALDKKLQSLGAKIHRTK